MTTTKLVNLVLKSSDSLPYTGKLPEKDNIVAAIDLAKLLKKYADDGYNDEAMNIRSEQWIEVINKLNDKLENISEIINNYENIKVVSNNYKNIPKKKYLIALPYSKSEKGFNHETILVSAIDEDDAIEIVNYLKPNRTIGDIKKVDY